MTHTRNELGFELVGFVGLLRNILDFLDLDRVMANGNLQGATEPFLFRQNVFFTGMDVSPYDIILVKTNNIECLGYIGSHEMSDDKLTRYLRQAEHCLFTDAHLTQLGPMRNGGKLWIAETIKKRLD